MRELDQFYLNLEEPDKSCFLALRDIILGMDKRMEPKWSYKLPFFHFKRKAFCYIWKDKKTNQPYIGIVRGNLLDNPLLEKGDRSRIKILRVNPNEDLPIDAIHEVLNEAMGLY